MATEARHRAASGRASADRDHRPVRSSDAGGSVDLAHLVESLTIERDALHQRVVELEKIISGDTDAYLGLGLTSREAIVLGALMRREVLTIEDMGLLLSRDPNDDRGGHGRNVYIVLVKRMRERLAPHGIHISTRWGAGYFLTPGAKERVLLLTGILRTTLPR